MKSALCFDNNRVSGVLWNWTFVTCWLSTSEAVSSLCVSGESPMSALSYPGSWGVCTWPKGGRLEVISWNFNPEKWVPVNRVNNCFWKRLERQQCPFPPVTGDGVSCPSDTSFRWQSASWWQRQWCQPRSDCFWHDFDSDCGHVASLSWGPDLPALPEIL